MHAPLAPVRVWDRFVRLFHWSLVALVGVCATTGFLLPATWIDVHVATGTAIVGLVTARVVWGFLGPREARFAAFRPTFAGLRAHLGAAPHRTLGHNPLGALMVFALLAVLAAILATGVAALGGTLKSGPLAADLAFTTGRTVLEWHEVLAIGLLGLVGLHVAGAIFESLRTRENLVLAMVTGLKRADPAAAPVPRVTARPRLAVAVTTALLATLAAVALGLAARPVADAPVPNDALVARECGACHFAYPASLLPAESWRRLIAGLDDHFGDVATLPPAEAAAIEAFLVAHAAETADTKPAVRFRLVDPAHPFTITATPFWRRTHAGLDPAVFSAPAVGGRGACSACHADAASARFHPGRISLPPAPVTERTTP